MRIPILDLKPQLSKIREDVRTAIDGVLDSTQFIMGPQVKEFEAEAAKYLGVKHAIGVNSGTDALTIALRAAGVKKGDEVITTPFTFFATAESIEQAGGTPVFADIDESSFNLDPAKVEEKITERTKAIVPVHLYGRPCAMDELRALAEKNNLLMLEDCAQSFGAKFQGKTQTGSLSNAGAFSFFPSKNLGAYGDGGLISTNDDQLAEEARMLRVHGAKKKYHNEVLGYNSRLDSIQAAILNVKIKHIDEWNEGRRTVAARYNELLKDVSGVIAPELAEGHVFHQYTIRVLNDRREEVANALKEKGIGTMIYYPVPIDHLPLYKGKYGTFEASERLSKEVLSLPIWPEQEASVTEEVAREIEAILS